MTATPASSEAVDELAATVREDPSGPNLVRLWRAVYGLEQWWLLPTGDVADPRPMVGVVEDRTFLLAFTSEHRIRDFAGERAAAAGGGTALMAVTPAGITELAPALAGQGVAGILFDHGVHGFVAPVAGLEAMLAQFGTGPPATGHPAGPDSASR